MASDDTVELARLSSSPSEARPDGKDNSVPKVNLHLAARDNRVEVVDQWIRLLSESNVVQLNSKDKFGYAPLHYAAKFNRFKILVKLIEAGADPNARTREEGFTPLHFAARYTPRIIDRDIQLQESESGSGVSSVEVGKRSSSVQVVQYLVNLRKGRKVKINAQAQYGITPLHLACQRGNRMAVSVLLRSNDITVTIADDNKDTPLHEACLNGHADIVENLITRMKLENPDATMDVNPHNSEAQTPLHVACREGHVAVVKTLLKHVSAFEQRAALTTSRDNERNTPLHLACESGVDEIVRILVLNGADLFATKLDDVSPMHIAARYGFMSIADVLLSSGEDLVDVVEIYNQTPLHYAAASNQVDMISFLIDHKADVTVTDTESYTPLMSAVQAGHVEAFKVLLSKDSAIDETDEDGKTIVHLAAEGNHVDILKEIAKNKDGLKLFSSTDTSHNTPLHLAASRGNKESVEQLLQSNRGNVKIDAKNELNKTPTHLAASKGHVLVIEALLKYKKDSILDEDEDGNTPLHLAALNGFSRSVKVLLESQADFDARNATLWTPMDCAAFSGHEKVVEVLIDAGADVNPTDKLQITPLHLAAQAGHLNVVKVLLENNADVGKCSANNLNSLDMAIDNGHEDIALLIVKSKHWKSALRNTSLNPLGVFTTPLRKLIKKMPDVAEEVFNRCCVGNETKDGKIGVDSKDYRLTFNYEFLEDFQDKKRSRYFSSFFKSKTDEDASDTDGASVDALSEAPDEKKFSKHGYTTFWGPVGFSKKLHPLSVMVANNRTDLLKHPLVTSLLKLKWRTYGRTAYFTNLSLFVLFVIFITAFALLSLNPEDDKCNTVLRGSSRAENSAVYSIINDSLCVPVDDSVVSNASMITNEEICGNSSLRERCGVSDLSCENCGIDSSRRIFLYFASSFVIFMAVVRLFFELFQLITLKLYYFLDWVNWIEVTLFVCSILFVSVYRDECLCPTGWQWQVGCVAVFLTWIDLVIFSRKIPQTGIYVLMFLNIFYTFCKMIILTMLLILGFSFAFFMALSDPSEEFRRSSFATPARAIFKTMTMTTGEFEYDSIFRQFPGGTAEGSDDITTEIPFLPVSFLLWIIFLVLMPILLTNLLVGLAVDDIKGIQDAAVLKRLALQVELALSVEELLPVQLRRYFIREEFVVAPNRKLNYLEHVRQVAFGPDSSRFDDQENITNALHPQPTPIELVQHQTRDLVLDMKKMKTIMLELAERNSVMEKLIREMAKKENIAGDELQRSVI